MSVFVVSKEHIDAMLSSKSDAAWFYEGQWHKLGEGEDTRDRVGAMLWAENVASVEHRYSPPGREAIYGEGWESSADFSLPGTYKFPEWVEAYSYKPTRPISAVEGLKLIGCYEYQSCEHEGWEGSEAAKFCEYLKDSLIGELPGYSDAAWEFRR